MADLVDILNKINISTEYLRGSLIQEILQKAKYKNVSEHDEILWSKVLDRLWEHLAEGLKCFDDQLLCATCFYTVLSLTKKQEVYLKNVLPLINNEILFKQKSTKLIKQESTSRVVSLMYGMFQSTFLTHCYTDNLIILNILEANVKLLELMASEYSKYTFLAFKILNSFKKTIGTKYQDIVYSATNVKGLINLVNHNWENPITGVRDLNKLIFKTVIDIMDKDLHDTMLSEINSFYWNKAKYLMLAEIIENYGHDINVSVEKDWVDGIFNTLYKPGLVSAGADMYYAIIKNVHSEEKWCMLFLDKTVRILNGNLCKAIENFTNYWCLTTFKRFPQLLSIILNEQLKYERTEMNLLSCLCILKQGARLGLINMNTDTTEQCVLQGIEHENNRIRMLSFEVISISQRKSLPTALEYNIVLNYLENNVNSDCTVLRISMLNNLKLFLGQLQGLSSIKNKDTTVNKDLLQFYKKLQDVLVTSIKSNGNYQRKVTTIKACNILLSSFNNKPKKRQKSGNFFDNILKETGLYKIELFEEEFIMVLFGLLKDPADDIRENTIQLLLNHYPKDITSVLINNLIDDAQTNIKSKFFFQISCSQGIFRLVASLLMRKAYTGTVFKTIDDILSNIFDELKTEHENKRNIVESIEVGKQTHSLLGIILEVLKVAQLNSYTIVTLNNKLPHILKIIEDVSNQFTWEVETSTSSDFSKMNDMIQDMITSSGLNPVDDNDYTKISGLQQIVLNCLWFNVKASCDLASFLIQFLDDKQMLECEKCLTIVMHVLETSRHKGVIEAAGAALGRAIQYLTSLPDDNQLSKLPFSLLKCKLKDLISYTNMASVTRRGAGLSIMVHRIVSSDMKKGKPLFHYFMDNILETCISSTELINNLDETQKDLPKAIYIHFLTKIVTDSSLASDMMYYSVELAEIAFNNLTSPHWQIRNAALQLYGALIPKLIGQKKASGSDDETVATVAFDEFRIHSPKLWEHMKLYLKNINKIEDLLAHSNTVPILNVLANLAKRYNFSFDNTIQELIDEDLFQSLVLLLGSPIYTVRRLCAKSIFNVFNFETIFQTIMELDMNSENSLHGSLMLLVCCHKYYSMQHQDQLSDIIQKIILVFNTRKHSYINKQLFEELLGVNHIKDVQGTLSELRENTHLPGISHWAKSRLRKYILHSSWDVVFNILTEVSTERDFDDYCQFVLMKVDSEVVSVEKYQALSSKLLTLKNISESPMVWKILYHISSKVKLNGNLLPIDVTNNLENNNIPYTMRYTMPYLATIAESLKHEYLVKLANLIFTSCDPEKCDVDVRHIAALANNELGKVFSKIADSIKVTALKSAIILLQDEDDEVRRVSTHFYMNLSKNDNLLHPYVSLHKILDYKFLEQIFANPIHEISVLCDEISSVLNTYTNSNIDEYNPFTSDSKNIYFEVEIVKRLVINLRYSLK